MENPTERRQHHSCTTKELPEVVEQSLIVVNVLCAIATIVLNSMVCAAVYKVKSLRKPSNILLTSLSVVQLLVTSDFVAHIVFLSSHDIQYEFCLIVGRWHYIKVLIIILHLTAISIDRLIAIQWHMRYRSVVTNRRMLGCVTVLWILGTFLAFFNKIFFPKSLQETKAFHKFSFGCSHPNGTCYHKWVREKHYTENERENLLHQAQLSVVVKLIVNLAIPFTIIAVCYAVILKTSMKHYKQIKAQNPSASNSTTSEIRAAKTIAIIIVSFVVCFTPMFAISVVQVYMRPRWGKHYALKLLVLMSCLSAIFNPLIYAGRNGEFREAFRKILRPLKRQNKDFSRAKRDQVKCTENLAVETPKVSVNENKVDCVKQNEIR